LATWKDASARNSAAHFPRGKWAAEFLADASFQVAKKGFTSCQQVQNPKLKLSLLCTNICSQSYSSRSPEHSNHLGIITYNSLCFKTHDIHRAEVLHVKTHCLILSAVQYDSGMNFEQFISIYHSELKIWGPLSWG